MEFNLSAADIEQSFHLFKKQVDSKIIVYEGLTPLNILTITLFIKINNFSLNVYNLVKNITPNDILLDITDNDYYLKLSFNSYVVYHKNPICVKLYKKGTINAIGIKNNEEVKMILTFLNNNTNGAFNTLQYNNIEYSAIYSNFKIKNKINTMKLFELLNENNDLFLIKNNKDLTIKMNYLGFKNKNTNKKNKVIIPTIQVCSTGFVKVVAINNDILDKCYDFIDNVIRDNLNELVIKV